MDNMERQEIDQLLSQFEVLLSPKIETFVDYLALCPLPNLLEFQQCVNELVESRKTGIQTPLKNKEWYVDKDDQSKYLDLEKKYLDLEKKYQDTVKKYVELQVQSANWRI